MHINIHSQKTQELTHTETQLQRLFAYTCAQTP